MARATRLSGSLPVSIAVHAVILLVLLAIPLMDLALPLPSALQMPYIRAIAAPPPPPLVRVAPPPARQASAASDDLAPLAAPDRILPERAASEPMPDLPVGEAGGVGADVGGVIDGPARPPVLLPPPVQRPAGPIRVSELVKPPRKLVDVRP